MKWLYLILFTIGCSLPRLTHAQLRWPEQRVPPASLKYIPDVKLEVARQFPEYERPWLMAAQIEQETCYSATHSKCWNPNATLKTSREYGFGIGQTTIAYDKYGKERFNNFNEAKKLPGLSDWKWENRYDFDMQLTVLIQSMRVNWVRTESISYDLTSHEAMSLNSYNGGYGGLLKDRNLCASIAGCNEKVWYGNVELYSTKSKVPHKGYSKSFFEISREYPDNIQNKRSSKYQSFWNTK